MFDNPNLTTEQKLNLVRELLRHERVRCAEEIRNIIPQRSDKVFLANLANHLENLPPNPELFPKETDYRK